MNKVFRFAITALVTVVLLTGCTTTLLSKSMLYDISYCSADNEPVFIEKVKYDQTEVFGGGIVMGYWKRTSGSILLYPPPSVPKEIYIYWFNYRQQVFYEATVPLKKNAEEIMRKLPIHEYGEVRYLTTGVLPDGKSVVWVSNGTWSKDSIWIEVGRAQGKRAAGDPASRKNTTEEMRKRGEI